MCGSCKQHAQTRRSSRSTQLRHSMEETYISSISCLLFTASGWFETTCWTPSGAVAQVVGTFLGVGMTNDLPVPQRSPEWRVGHCCELRRPALCICIVQSCRTMDPKSYKAADTNYSTIVPLKLPPDLAECRGRYRMCKISAQLQCLNDMCLEACSRNH